jgi:hypothetical protein
MIDMNKNLDSDVTAVVNILGDSYHIGDKVNFLLKESKGQIVGYLIAGGKDNEINPENALFSDKIIVYATGYKNDGIYAVFETDIAKVEFKKDYSGNSSKESKFDWE